MILGLTVIALIFASCSKDEVSNVNRKDPNAISLDPTTGKTRADVMDLDGLKEDAAGFGVFATSASTPTFINNEAYRWATSGTGWGWAGTDRYWPRNEDAYPINFYAYHPLANTTLDTDLEAEYTIADTPEAQVDLLAAQQLNVIVRPATGNVNLAFKHILSKVDFKVKAGANVTVHVQSIAIKHVANKRTFDYANLAWITTPPSVFASNYYFMPAPIKPENIFEGPVTSVVTGSSASLMLMPQDLSGQAWDLSVGGIATDAYIQVVYRVNATADGENIVGYMNVEDHPDYDVDTYTGAPGGLYVKVGFPLPTNWLMSTAYMYTIYLGILEYSGGYLVDTHFIDEDGNPVDFTVHDPGTEEEIDITDPINGDKLIGFEVSVDTWGDPDDIDVQ